MPPRKKLTLLAPAPEGTELISFKKELIGVLEEQGKFASPNQRKIAIVGCYPGSWELAPYSDDSWEIWGFSRRNKGMLPRCDRWFELHDASQFARYDSEVHGYSEYLRTNKGVVLQADFPVRELIDRFGPYFFSEGQSAWMMAYAITKNPAEIGIWGIESLAPQYAKQRWCLQHFVQVARDLGILVTVPEGCTLLEPYPLYGFPPALAT